MWSVVHIGKWWFLVGEFSASLGCLVSKLQRPSPIDSELGQSTKLTLATSTLAGRSRQAGREGLKLMNLGLRRKIDTLTDSVDRYEEDETQPQAFL